MRFDQSLHLQEMTVGCDGLVSVLAVTENVMAGTQLVMVVKCQTLRSARVRKVAV